MDSLYKTFQFIRDTFNSNEFIALHEPRFIGNERQYVNATIDSTFVSSVGQYVTDFEVQLTKVTHAKRAIATVNGTAALHVALQIAGVQSNDLVITQALTFIATCNALHMIGAEPVFLDIDSESLGLSPTAVANFLESEAEIVGNGQCIYKKTGQRIAAIVPMHTFGHPVDLDAFVSLSKQWHIPLVEDAAESLGSFYKSKHTGTFGISSALSFNGNKIITTGGGGAVLVQNNELGDLAKHITTTAKIPHPYEFVHDTNGYNYRMPNINAALGVAQLENLDLFLQKKRQLAWQYQEFFKNSEFTFVQEPSYAQSNYWLNAIVCTDRKHRDEVLEQSGPAKIMMRPVWTLMNKLPMYTNSICDELTNSHWFESRIVNIPSSVISSS